MNYKLTELFVSLMGETRYIGYPALFIRFAGCNLRCKWCDTSYSQNPAEGKTYSFSQITEEMKNGPKVVVFTGGEPLIQKDVFSLMEFAKENGKTVVVYTNDSIDISPFQSVVDSFSIDFKLKQRNRMCAKNLTRLKVSDDLKFVIADRKDFDDALKLLRGSTFKKVRNSACEVYMTPASNNMDPRVLARWIQEERLWFVRQGIQMHKVIWGPDIRGV